MPYPKQALLEQANVVVKPSIQRFHYEDTPFANLHHVLLRLQKDKQRGKVIRVDKEKDAIGVLFPMKNNLLWFKPYEIEVVG